MQKIKLQQAFAGMVLANEILSPDGKILVNADAKLDDASLRRLDLAGVTKIVVHGKPVPDASMGYNALERAIRLDFLFRKHQDDKFMLTLKNMLFKHFMLRT